MLLTNITRRSIIDVTWVIDTTLKLVIYFREVIFRGAFFRGGTFFPEAFFRTPALVVQWNLSKADTYGTEVFVRFREVSALQRFELKSSQI